MYANPRSIGMSTHNLHDCTDTECMFTDTCKQHVAMHLDVHDYFMGNTF